VQEENLTFRESFGCSHVSGQLCPCAECMMVRRAAAGANCIVWPSSATSSAPPTMRRWSIIGRRRLMEPLDDRPGPITSTTWL
jgi:hypothetical protein